MANCFNIYYKMNNSTKICSSCKQEKNLDMFYNSKTTKDKKQYKCKTCDSSISKKFRDNNPEYMKIYFKNNKEYYNELHKQWNENNREYLNDYHLNYRKQNQQKIQEYQNIWFKEKYETDINYKLKINIKTRILASLKNNSNKKEKINKYLGCSIQDYKTYLETLFLPEMNWNNHGEIWEIDHKKPISSFDLSIKDNIFNAFHYTNTQPLFKTTEIAESFGYKNYIGNRNKGYKENGILVD